MVMIDKGNPEGGCACGKVRYRLLSPPMLVHCCHCLGSYPLPETGPAESLERRTRALGG